MEGRRSLAAAYDPEGAAAIKELIDRYKKEMEEDKLKELRGKTQQTPNSR